MKTTYDFVIIGAGPAGLMAARELGRAGQNVLIVDIKKDITEVNRSCCTMLINEPNTHGETCRVVDNNIYYEKTNFTARYTGQWVKMVKSIRLTPGGYKLTMVNEKEGVALPYNKRVLLSCILEDALAAGVKVRTETAGIHAENVDGGVKVYLRGTRSRTIEQVTCKAAIAADGVNSQIVKGLELSKQRKYFTTYKVMGYFLEGVECPYPPSWITFVGKHLKVGAGQMYMLPKHLPNAKPGDDPVIDITCGTPVGLSAKVALDHFLREGRFAHWFRNAKVIHTTSAILNFYTCIQNPVEGNVLVAGDAASFIETYCQSAMMYGYRAAHAALKVQETGKGYEEYTEFWRKSFEYCWPGEIDKAIQGFGFHILSNEELDYVFSLTDDEEYEGYVSENTAPDILKRAIFNHIDQMKKEKPEVARKIENYWRTTADNIFKEERSS